VEDCEVELGDPLGVDEEVDLDDLPVLDRHGADGELGRPAGRWGPPTSVGRPHFNRCRPVLGS
jgi:hypothetical protein